jgi:LysR family glycine cleavage system transcriptional activator
MTRRLPPLNGIRAFEAAARHLSFTRAAEEMSVTQAAVSQQVRKLEDWLGRKLFRRADGGLELTEAGDFYLPAIADALDIVADRTAALRPVPGSGVLTVSALPSFARKWLVSRLPGFAAVHPDVDVNLDTGSRLVDFTQEPVDCGIRYGRGAWNGVLAEKLFDLPVFPVCSPSLIDGPDGLRTVADLRRHRLLHDDTLAQWKQWLRAAGETDLSWVRGTRAKDMALLIQMAVEGHGVVLAQSALVLDDLAAGRLCRPFALTLAGDAAYYFVAPRGALGKPLVRAFRDWLFAEAAASLSAEKARTAA